MNKHKLVAKAEAQSGKKASAKPAASAPAVKSGLLLSHYNEGDSVIVTAWGGKYSGTVQKVCRRQRQRAKQRAKQHHFPALLAHPYQR